MRRVASRRRRGVRRSRRGRFVSANPARRVVRRRRSRRSRNPSGYVAIPRLLRRRKGRFVRTGRVVRHNPRRRRARRNSWFKEPIRHARASRKGWRRRTRRSYRNNPPLRRRRLSGRRHARRNPRYGRRRMRLLSNPIDSIMGAFQDAFSGDTLTTVAQMGVGFGGALAIAKLVASDKALNLTTSAPLDKVGRVGVTAGATIAESVIFGFLGQSELAARALVGGMLATFWQGLTEILPAEAKRYVPTLGDAETDRFRKAIEQEVLRELNGGMNAYLEPASAMSAYMQPAGASGYLTTGDIRAGQRDSLGAYLTEREARRYGMGRVDMEFNNNEMAEKF